MDLVTEAEEFDDTNAAENEVDEEIRRMKDYEEYVEKHTHNGSDDLANLPDEEFEKYTSQIDDDKLFHKFKKRIANDPEQVIRFDRGGNPLWITTKNQPNDRDIPSCEKCKASRVFEFQVSFRWENTCSKYYYLNIKNLLLQIMPQLLNSYKDLSVDWGVIAIYTCSQSCDTDKTYVDEFCYKQDLCDDSQEQN